MMVLPLLKLGFDGIGAALAVIWNIIKQPPGSYIALMAAIVLAWWLSGQRGYDRGHNDCEGSHAAAVAALGKAQDGAVLGAKVSSQARTQAQAPIEQHNQQKVIYVVQTVAARPDAHDICLDAAAADSLRDLQ